MSFEPVVAICSMFRDEADAVEEWIAFHILQGVAHFVLYDNQSEDDTAARALRFAKRAHVTVVPWRDTRHGFHVTQLRAFLDGTARLAGVADFVAYIDLDEFLYPRNAATLGAALAAFPPDVSAIAVNQRIFGSSGQERVTVGLVIERFTSAAPPDFPEAAYFKTIARPACLAGFDSSHSAVLARGRYAMSDGRPLPPRAGHPGHSSVITDGVVRLHHYILKSREEYEVKQRRWSGQDLRAKYSTEYFDGRETSLRTISVHDARLAAFATRVRALIGEARAGTAT